MSRSFLQLLFFILFSFSLYFFIPLKVSAQEVTITAPVSADYNHFIDVTINHYGTCPYSNQCSVVLFDGNDQELQRQPCGTTNGICFMVVPYFTTPKSGPPKATIRVFDSNNQLLPGGQKTISLTGTPQPTPNPAAGCEWPDNGNCRIGSAPHACIVNHKVLWCCPNQTACDAQVTQVPELSPACSTESGAINPCTSAAGQPCPNGQPGINTALGCIPTEPIQLIQGLLKFSIGIGGAIALLLMIYGAFQMITSVGNPDNVKKGADQFTNAVIGLLFIIFSVMLLQIIGADILSIPGFTK